MAGILVFGDVAGTQLNTAALEVAYAGADLAASFAEPLIGALIGPELTSAAQCFNHGLSSLYLAEGLTYRPYNAKAYVQAARTIVNACQPSIVLFPHTFETRDWVPQLAAALDTGLVMDCVAIGAEGSELVVSKPVYGGGVHGEFVIHGKPKMVTIRPGIFTQYKGHAIGETISVKLPPPPQSVVTLLDEVASTPTGGLRLRDASIVVSGGRGIGGPDNWHFIEQAAIALNAAVGCSRPVADSGWVPALHQVGLSGTSVNADLYVAVGISGAVQHLAGISSAKTVVAINRDPEAEIFKRANYGVVGDFKEVLPAFVRQVEVLRNKV